MGSKPKTPAPTQSEIEADRFARKTSNDLTRDENARLKGIMRGRGGRRSLLGSSNMHRGGSGAAPANAEIGTLNRVPSDSGGVRSNRRGRGILGTGRGKGAAGGRGGGFRTSPPPGKGGGFTGGGK